MALGYDSIIAEASRKYGVPEATIRAVMGVESGGRADAVSPKGAAGLMQIMAPTYHDVAKRHGLGPDRFDPTNNIMAGTAYLGEMHNQFGNWDEALMAYNMGPGRMTKVRAGTATVPGETRDYLPKVRAALGQGDAPAPAPAPLLAVDVGRNMYAGPQPVRNEGGDMTGPRLMRPQPGQTVTPGSGSLLDVDETNNWLNGLGGLLGEGQTGSQPPGPSISPLQYQLAGAGSAVGQLAGITNRRVGIGELLGALGGGLTQGAAAGIQAQRQQRADERAETGERFDNVYKAALARKALAPEPRDVKTVSTAEGVFTLNRDGSLGQRLGSPTGGHNDGPKVVGSYIYENGQFKAPPGANVGGGTFGGQGAEVQGVNYLIQQGIITPQQGATWLASKGVPGANGGYDIIPPTVMSGRVPGAAPPAAPPAPPNLLDVPVPAPGAAAPSPGPQTGPGGVISVRPGGNIPGGEATDLRKKIDVLEKLRGASGALGKNVADTGMQVGGFGASGGRQEAYYEDVQTQLRLANELGVLNGPDERKLLEQISNPTKFMAYVKGLGGPEYFNAQMDVLNEKINREIALYRERLGEKKPDEKPAGAADTGGLPPLPPGFRVVR